jgi:heme/copper-type cytochrome/quinol oxidase subunit 2
LNVSKKRWSVVLAIGLAGLTILFIPLPVHAAQPSARMIRVAASQFAYRPAVIRVNPGDTVTLEIVSTDVVHGVYIDGYGISASADPGQTMRLSFVAERSGSFRIRCNQPCGSLHPFMIGMLQVGSQTGLVRAIGLAAFGALAAVVASPSPRKKPVG